MKPFAPACERNRDPILDVLRPIFAQYPQPRVLEIGSGTGQHGVYFAAALPAITWILSDRDENHAGIRAWRDEAGLANLQGPLRLDVGDFAPLAPPVDVVFSANTAHIMGWEEVGHMVRGAAASLADGGRFLLYGPFRRGGRHTSDSNAAFDRSLRESSASMGIRDLEAVDELAQAAGLALEHVHAMPANNLLVAWRRGLPAPDARATSAGTGPRST